MPTGHGTEEAVGSPAERSRLMVYGKHSISHGITTANLELPRDDGINDWTRNQTATCLG